MREILNVYQVERIQNKMLYHQYTAKKKLLEKQNPPNTQNEQTLWHGTASDAVPSINTYGFNRSYCGKNGMSCCVQDVLKIIVENKSSTFQNFKQHVRS